MFDRTAFGDLPPKHHLASWGADRQLRYEACLTRAGFAGPYTICYHERRPQALRATGDVSSRSFGDSAAPDRDLIRRHYRTRSATAPAFPFWTTPLLHNAELVLGCAQPTHPDSSYRVNAGADELWFVQSGGGRLRSTLGDLDFARGDYVFLPKGLLYRLIPDSAEPQHYLHIECSGALSIPAHFRNPVGQLRMDAPYCHRDFKRPQFVGPVDEGLREVWVKNGERYERFTYPHSPLDVVGWDGCVYPWAFPILNFQPRVGSVHLPPIWHGTFEAPGALICSFVPRPLDFHPQAVPCPYTHTSADVDEVLFYVAGQFSSRLGVDVGSLTHHPAGIPHGPHPGRYEESLGARHTEEVAVMLDCQSRLQRTRAASTIEDSDYDASFS
jgi:homogentisate 1,2-dioxygenase